MMRKKSALPDALQAASRITVTDLRRELRHHLERTYYHGQCYLVERNRLRFAHFPGQNPNSVLAHVGTLT